MLGTLCIKHGRQGGTCNVRWCDDAREQDKASQGKTDGIKWIACLKPVPNVPAAPDQNSTTTQCQNGPGKFANSLAGLTPKQPWPFQYHSTGDQQHRCVH